MNDNSFITEHLALVHSIATKFKGRGIEYEELFSAGCVGLVKAGNNYDKSRGLQFSTYAVPVIMGEIKQLFRDGGLIKVSRSIKELSLKISRIKSENADMPIKAIAERLSVSVEDIATAIEASAPVSSLCAIIDGEEKDVPVSNGNEQEKISTLIALREEVSRLEASDRQLITLRYIRDCTQSRTAEIMGMTQVQVSRRERKILSELKRKLA